MKSTLLTVAALALLASPARAIEPQHGGHGEYSVNENVPCVTAEQHRQIEAQLAASIEAMDAKTRRIRSTEAVSFGWPLRLRAGLTDYDYHGISNFVDRDPTYPGHVLDYNCGTRTYDTSSGYNHQGTDIFTWPFSWSKVDNNDVEIVAAAAGTILLKSDGNYDRNCSLSGGTWNAVYVRHPDNSVAWYGHMKNGSLTPKAIGEAVAKGEYLGVVGSSGNSTGPHLHFEVYDPSGILIDPWNGPCNATPSWWDAQPPYYDSAVNAVMTHSAPPVFPACPGTETINADDVFNPGQTVYFATYYRDQLAGQVSDYTVFDPTGAVAYHWTHSIPSPPHYAASYWYWYDTIPLGSPVGQWRFQVIYQGKTYLHDFWVTNSVAVEPGAGPAGLWLSAASPNPARAGTSFNYRLPAPGLARLGVYDANGRRVATLVNGWQPAGSHWVNWPDVGGSVRVNPGLYFVRLEMGGAVRVQKVALTD